jgi:WhiB family transcriptional regulator, redox-sensing transcriptional regulator
VNPYTVAPYLREHGSTLRSGVRYQDWRDRVACRGADPELFFPQADDGTGRAAVAKAKAICAGCPVADQCLQFALASPEKHGTWGGLSERERHGMRPAAPAGPGLCRKRLHVMDAENTIPAGPAGEWKRCRACTNAGERARWQEAKYDREAAA